MSLLLLLGAELEQHRGAGHERRHLQDPGDRVADALLVERDLVFGGEAEPAVLLREAHAGEPAVEQHPLELAGAGDLGQLLFVALRGAEQPRDALGPREVLRQPAPGPEPEVFDALDVGGAHVQGLGFGGQAACARRAAMRWRWSVGVP